MTQDEENLESANLHSVRDAGAILFALVLPSLVTLVYFVWADHFSAGVQQATYSVAKLVQFGFPAFWMLVVLKYQPRWQRPTTRGVGLSLLFGLVVAIAMMLLYAFWLRETELFRNAEPEILAKIRGMQLNKPWRFIFLGIFYSLVHALLEEYYWRWFVFGQLQRYCSLGVAIAVSSLGFAAHHVIVLATYFGVSEPVVWLFSAGIAVGGAVWAWLYHHSGSLLGPWLSHLLVDTAIFGIGYSIAF